MPTDSVLVLYYTVYFGGKKRGKESWIMQGEIRKTAWRHAEWGGPSLHRGEEQGQREGLKTEQGNNNENERGAEWRGKCVMKKDRGGERQLKDIFMGQQSISTTGPCLNKKSFFCTFPLLNWVLTCDALQAALLYTFSQSPKLHVSPSTLHEQLQCSLYWYTEGPIKKRVSPQTRLNILIKREMAAAVMRQAFSGSLHLWFRAGWCFFCRVKTDMVFKILKKKLQKTTSNHRLVKLLKGWVFLFFILSCSLFRFTARRNMLDVSVCYVFPSAGRMWSQVDAMLPI